MIENLPIAPRLTNFRTARYIGDSQTVPLGILAPADQHRLSRLYEFVTNLQGQVGDPDLPHVPPVSAEAIAQCQEDARLLGTDSPAARTSELLQRAIHDVRGGSLVALLALLELHAYQPQGKAEVWRSVFYCCRDQGKIIRNGFPDVDPSRYEHDLNFKPHFLGTVMDKLEAVPRPRGDQQVKVSVVRRYEGPISSCCCESAAMDRVLHNLLNNACRHTVDERVRVGFLPLAQRVDQNLRVVVENAISEEDEAHFRQRLNADGLLPKLPTSELSTTGSGLGLNIAAAFIRDAYGLESSGEAWSKQYLGAHVGEGKFTAWFHWPLLPEASVA